MRVIYFFSAGLTAGFLQVIAYAMIKGLKIHFSDVLFLNDILIYGLITAVFALTDYRSKPWLSSVFVPAFLIIAKNTNKIVLHNLANTVNLKLLGFPVLLGFLLCYLLYFLEIKGFEPGILRKSNSP